ncbi:hypothetical protein L2K20_18540 [Mycobacterium sp. MBM]|nr:hypothetical protein [Mycobacterium sp. MBM]
MSVTGRARSAARVGVKVQRRVVIAQALWWPTLVVAGLAVGTATLLAAKRRMSAGTRPEPVREPAVSPEPTHGASQGAPVDA